MERSISVYLENWAKGAYRKPLIISGARQIGKSWSVANLGSTTFEGNYVVINFEKSPALCQLFERDLSPKRIIQELEISIGKDIDKNTLLFFDEIQQCPKAIMALRYIYEEMPEIAIVAAGSLLEFQLQKISFPVGRVQHVEMYPMNFEEFLRANGQTKLAQLLVEPAQELSEIVEEKMYEQMLNYWWVGGMPECVKYFSETNNYQEVRRIQEDLIYTYIQDFAKYDPQVNRDCLLDILNYLANNIGKQTIYTKLSERFSGPTIKAGVEVLRMAKLLYKVNNVSVSSLPFTSSNKQFKLYFIDIGLHMCLAKVPYETLMQNKNVDHLFSGAWAEQFVAQSLWIRTESTLYYWARAERNSNAEVDFVYEKNADIIPVEVKSGPSGRLRSLHQLLKENTHITTAKVYSKTTLGSMEKIHFVPIYYV
jgi:uncharacterized protein